MKVVITGSSKGIGKATALKFLQEGHQVYGIDILPPDDDLLIYKDNAGWKPSYLYSGRYIHVQQDILSELPIIRDVDILINNAGVQNSGHDIDINLKGLIKCTEQFGIQPNIKAIVNLASVSAHNGAEFPEYCASKGGVLSYTINTAKRIAEYGATCNSISFGGVITSLNDDVMQNSEKWGRIMEMTPLRKWATSEECAEWVYFVAVRNRSMSGQDIIVDNLESFNHTFVW